MRNQINTLSALTPKLVQFVLRDYLKNNSQRKKLFLFLILPIFNFKYFSRLDSILLDVKQVLPCLGCRMGPSLEKYFYASERNSISFRVQFH